MLRSPAHDALLLQAAQADGHPLPRRADHVGEVGVREGGSDQDAVPIFDAVSVDKMEQQVRKALGDRAGAEHLRESRSSICP